jgi:type II secretory ATPase GspE/PulE/Tfp pilus assembly ATPase PilB-like protein
MISLEQDGIMKALNGHTSLEEVYRVAKSQKG